MALKSSSASSVSKGSKRGEKCRDTRAKLSVSATYNDCSDNRKKIQKRKTYSVHNRRIAHVEKYCGESSSDSEVDKRALPFTKYTKQHLSGDDNEAENQKKENQNCKKLTVRFSKECKGDENNEEWNKIVPEVVQITYPVFMPNIWHYLGYANAVKDVTPASTSNSEDEEEDQIPVITNIKTAKQPKWIIGNKPVGDIDVKIEVGDQIFLIKRKVLVQHSLCFRKALLANDPLPVSVTLNHVDADDFKIIKNWMTGKKHAVKKDKAIDIMVAAKRLEMPDLFMQCKSIIRCPAGADDKKESKSEAKKRKKEEHAKAKADKKEEKRKKKELEKRKKIEHQAKRNSSDITIIREAERKIHSQNLVLNDPFISDCPSTTATSGTTSGMTNTASYTTRNISTDYSSILTGAPSTDVGTTITGSTSNTTGCRSIAGSTNTATTSTLAGYETISELIRPVKSKPVKSDKLRKDKENEDARPKTSKTDVGVNKKHKTDKQRGGADKSQLPVLFGVDVDERFCKRRRKSDTTFVTTSIDLGCASNNVSEARRKQCKENVTKDDDKWVLPQSIHGHGKSVYRVPSSLHGRGKSVYRVPSSPGLAQMENPSCDCNEIPPGMLRIRNGKDAVLVDQSKAKRESRRLKRLIGDDDPRATTVNISKVTKTDLWDLAAWIRGDNVTITPANVTSIMTLAERLEMPVLLHKAKRYKLDVDEGCRSPRDIFTDEWMMNQLENIANEEKVQKQTVVPEILNEVCEAESLPFQETEYSDYPTEARTEAANEVHCTTSSSQTESSISTSTNTEEDSCKTMRPIDDCDNNNNNNNNLIMETIGHLFGWTQRIGHLCEKDSCKIASHKLLKSIQFLLCQENIVLGESYCGGNEISQPNYEGPASILKFPFDASKYHWVTGEPSTCHAFCAAVVFKGKLYVSGGRNIRSAKKNIPAAVGDIWRFDRNHDKWSHVGNLCVSRIHHCAIAFEDSIYFVGGLDDNLCMLSSVERLQITNESMSIDEVAPVSVARAGTSGTAHGKMLFVAGGISNHPAGNCSCHILDEMECYNSTSNKWHRLAPLAVPRAFATVISTNLGLFVIGGVTFKNRIEPTLESVYSVAEVEVYGSLRMTSPASLIKPRYAASAAVHNGHLYVFGGIELETGSHVSIVERFSTTQQNWVLANDFFSSQLLKHEI